MEKRYSIYVNIFLLAIFTLWFIYIGNYEFIGYIVSIGFIIWLVYYTDKKFNYLPLAMWGLSLWLFLHLAGGAFIFGGVKLYGIVLIKIIGAPYYLLKYDQVVHLYCYFIVTLFVYSIVQKITNEKSMKITSLVIVILASIGIGALNEIIEFAMVIFANASVDVGSYTNNALDLVFNLIGAITSIFIAKRL